MMESYHSKSFHYLFYTICIITGHSTVKSLCIGLDLYHFSHQQSIRLSFSILLISCRLRGSQSQSHLGTRRGTILKRSPNHHKVNIEINNYSLTLTPKELQFDLICMSLDSRWRMLGQANFTQKSTLGLQQGLLAVR